MGIYLKQTNNLPVALKYRNMIKIILFVGLVGVFMDTTRCSPLLSHDIRPGRPLSKMTADDPMKMMDAPLKNIVHQGEEARSDCGGGCFNVRNCYLQACKKCPR